MRVWASDQQDYESDLGVNLGLQGINITLQVKGNKEPYLALTVIFGSHNYHGHYQYHYGL